MTNNTWPSSFDDLDINIPWTETNHLSTVRHEIDNRSNQDWSIGLWKESGVNGVRIECLAGNYAGAGFWIWFQYNRSTNPLTTNVLYCAERHTGNIKLKKAEGDYCKKIFSGTKTFRGGYVQYFKLP